MEKAVVVLSGGMDSATALYKAIDEGFEVSAISFNYGQRHLKELDYAIQLCEKVGVNHSIVDLTSITRLISNSALTGDIEVPEGHYAQENMKLTVVPNRNMIMYAIAVGYAINSEAGVVFVGVHAGDHPIYPDCRPEFIRALDLASYLGNFGFFVGNFQLVAPFINLTKADIVKLGNRLGVPYDLTWSCYKGGEKHCGKCGTCQERRESFILAGIADPTEYET